MMNKIVYKLILFPGGSINEQKAVDNQEICVLRTTVMNPESAHRRYAII